jgi:hypothetical protein
MYGKYWKSNTHQIFTFFSNLNLVGYLGINNAIPQATLDVVAKNSTGLSTDVDGLLIPRIDRERAQSMTGIPESTLIYVDNISTGTQAGMALNIDKIGYYYYDGALWIKLNSSAGIYDSDGTLTGNRIVAQRDKTLAFTGTAANAFSVDGNTLSIDASNNRTGFGTITPETPLDVTTPDNNYGIQHSNGTIKLRSHIENDRAAWGTFTPHSLDVFTNGSLVARFAANGDVGIGTSAPSAKLEVNGTLKFPTAGTPAAGKVLTSDAMGNATWATPSNTAVIASYSINSDQNISPGNTVIFNQLLQNSSPTDISLNTSTGIFTFSPGTWLVTLNIGCINAVDSSTRWINIEPVNNSSVASAGAGSSASGTYILDFPTSSTLKIRNNPTQASGTMKFRNRSTITFAKLN